MDIVTCPATNQIVQLLRGQISEPLATQLSAHILKCSRCSQSIELLGEGDQSNPSVGPKAGLRASAMSGGPESASSDSDESQTNQLSFLAPPLGPDEIGWLAHYRILRILGEGGMGIVLCAEDTQLKRSVALKVIKAEYNREQETRQRFLREARAMAQVKSDHVVTIYQVGQDNEACFIAMELLEGEPLNSLLDRETKLTMSETVRIGREVAHALAAAHAKGLIHRDIKPENVWLEAPVGRAKLLDFGLARAHTANVKLTSSGIIIGTPAYMAPEQARAEPLDERSDLFSLGSLLYELSTGLPPFAGESVTAILIALISDDPVPPSQHNPLVPPELDELILHLLAKKREDRPSSALAVIKRLDEIFSGAVPADRTVASSGMTGSRTGARSAALGADLVRSTQLTGRVLDAEHRQVTVLVCSCTLFDSEDYLERLDAEDQAKLLGDFKQACEKAVRELDGTVVRWNEESLLACFGYPVAYEDAGARAAKTALTILEALNAVAEQVRRDYQVELGPWLGLHTGLAIAETKNDEVLLVGEARNIAVRLKDAAKAGKVICSETTHRLLADHFDCVSLGEHKVKNLAQPITLFQVKGVGEGVGHRAISIERTPLTGRDLEMNLLKSRWEQAQEGMGQVVLLTGEAGLGKSRLVHDLKQHVRGKNDNGNAGTSIVEWYCSPQFKNTGLYPIITCFQRLLRFGRDDAPAERFDRLMQHLEEYDLAQPDVVPIFASLLSVPTNEKFPSLELSPVREREEIFQALQDWLRAYSSKQPVLFVVEDLHWLDASTLEFLGQFLAGGQSEQILTLLTFRPEFQVPWTTLTHQTSLSLNRLTKSQVGDLMRKKTGDDVPQALIDQVYDRAGGVPLFIEEFTKMVQETGMCDQARASGGRMGTLMSHAIPTTLQDLIMARLDRMEGDREVAQIAATIGRNFSYELLAAVSNLDRPVLDAELQKLVQAEILFEKGRPPRSGYIFKHALLEDALYNGLVKSKRQQYHGRIAEALETQEAAKLEPELVAYHFIEAGRIEKAIPYLLAAGTRAQEKFANVEAIEQFTKGLDLLSTLPEAPERDASELSLLNRLGPSYQAAFGYAAPKVGPTFARARELCRKTGQTEQLFAVMWGNWTWNMVRGDLRLCMEIADEVMALANYAQDQGISMEAYAVPAVTLFYRGDFAGCREHSEEAIAMYEDPEECRNWSSQTGQNSAITHRCYLALSLWHLGYPDRASRMMDETLALAREIAHPFSLAHALHFAAWFHHYRQMGELQQKAAAEEIAVATEQGFALWHATGTFLQGAGMYWQGSLDEAVPRMEKGVQMFRDISAALTLPAQLCVLAKGYLKTGSLAESRQALQEGLALCEKNDDRSHEAELQRLEGELVLAESGDKALAEQCFRKAIETARGQKSRAWELRATVSLAGLLKEKGDREEARTALATVYGEYKDGFDTPDLMSASELLKTLA